MKITVYTITDCQFSKEEKEYLQKNNLQFEEKNLETNHEFLTEMLNISNNFAGTPVTKVEKDDGSSKVLKGFTVEEFDEAFGIKTKTEPKDEKHDAAKPADSAAKTDSPVDGSAKTDSSAATSAKADSSAEASAKAEEPKKDEAAAPPQVGTQAAPPPTQPAPRPEVPAAPQPPQPTTPQPPTGPQNPVPDVSAGSQQQPPAPPTNGVQPYAQTGLNAPLPVNVAPDEPAVDDSSLEAILSELQEKTNEPATPTAPAAPSAPAMPVAPTGQTPPPPAGNLPTIPDFGSSV